MLNLKELKELKHYLIVNLSYRITKQLLTEKIYSKVINNICIECIKYYKNTNEAKHDIDKLFKCKNASELINFGFN